LREEQARPFVVIDFEVAQSVFFLVVSNTGTTLARDVRFKIDPPFSNAIRLPLGELTMFSEGISTLAPGKTIRTVFDSAIQRHEGEFPYRYQVEVSYSDQTRRRPFTEEIDLDLGIYRNLSTVTRYDIHDVHERLKNIRDEMKKWTSGSRGLLRLSPGEARAEADAQRRALEELRRRRGERSGESD
jgi:hypothetical protein